MGVAALSALSSASPSLSPSLSLSHGGGFLAPFFLPLAFFTVRGFAGLGALASGALLAAAPPSGASLTPSLTAGTGAGDSGAETAPEAASGVCLPILPPFFFFPLASTR